MKISKLKICENSNLVIRQLNGDFAVKEPNLVEYREEILDKLKGFESYELESVLHHENKYADTLATLILKIGNTGEKMIQIPLETKERPIEASSPENTIWMQVIKAKLEDPTPQDYKEIKSFMLLNSQLYKKLGDRVLARCVSEEFGRQLLEEVHAKVCGLRGPILSRRIQRLGYFWPEMRKEAAKLQKKCE
ncbi:Ribonuclease H-like domain containing protein [Trema orientale]|uniref:Ribonuclease H-like domain containing protein n=1 Tax=Trema orientale TaxID=63057 RepID=A0A2P5CLH6_TREOI|nr:Ribonuclease H-like domain containing protein [Trema orientale]